MDVLELTEQIGSLTLLEAAQLTKQLEQRLGVSAQQAQTVIPANVTPTVAVEEQTEFAVVLENAGATKINVIKVIREITGLGLKEAKDKSENLPQTIKEGVSKADAAAIQEKLTAAGASVVVR